jgi:hypothetical protein
MKDSVKLLVAGIVGVALVTAFGLHSQQLAQLPKPTGQALSGVFSSVETGQNESGS